MRPNPLRRLGLLAEEIGRTGPTMVIENRPGAGAVIGSEALSRAPPDGSTLLRLANSFVINPRLRKLNCAVASRAQGQTIAQHCCTAEFQFGLCRLGVKSALERQREPTGHVRFAPKADKQQTISSGPLSANRERTQRSKKTTRSPRRRSRGETAEHAFAHPSTVPHAVQDALQGAPC
jgi:hypothetical protein